MRSTAKTRLAAPYGVRLAGPLVAAALALTACSGTDDATDDAAGNGSGGSVTDPLAATVAAVEDQDTVHLTIGDGGDEPPFDVYLATAEPRTMQVMIDTAPGETVPDDMELRLVEDTLYVGGEVADGWQSIPADDPRALGEEESFDAGFVPALLAIDPAGELEALEAASTEVELVGEEVVESVDTRHWRITVDTALWLAALSSDAMQNEVDLMETTDVDLWVGPDDLPVRMSYAVGTVGEDEAVNQVDYVEWGLPLDVSAPAGARPLR